MTLQELIVKIGADIGDYVSNIDQAISKTQSAGASLSSIGATLSAGLTAPLSAIGAAALKASSDVQAASNEIRVATGATGDALAGLNSSFKNVFADVPASAKSVADAIAGLNQRLGLTGAPLEALTTQLTELAHITHQDVQPLVESTAKTFNEWQIATKDQADALDFLFRVSQNSGATVGKLQQELIEFGPTLKNLGFSFQDAALLLGQLDKQGVDASAIMPGLRKEFANLAKAGIDGAAAFQQIVQGIQDGSISLKQALDIFGAKSGGTVFQLIQEGKLDFDAFSAAVKGSSDTITQAAAQTRTFGDEMKIAWNQIELALAPLGDALKSVFKSAFEDIQPLLGVIHDLGQAFADLDPGTQKVVVGIGLIVAAAGPAAIALGGVTSALTTVSGLLGSTGIAATAFGGTVGGLASIALPAFAAAVLVTVDDLGKLQDKWKEVQATLNNERIYAAINAGDSLDQLNKLGIKTADLKTALQGFGQQIQYDNQTVGAFGPTLKQLGTTADQVYKSFQQFSGVDLGIKVVNSGLQGKPAPSAPAPLDLSGVGKGAGDAILSVQQLIEKQQQLEQEEKKAEAAVADLTAREQQGQPVAIALAQAHDQLSKVLKEVAGQSQDVATIMRAALNDQSQAEARVNALNVAYKSLKEIYDRTGEGGAALVTVQKQLDEALKSTGKSATDLAPALANAYAKYSDATQAFLKQQDALQQAAEKQAGIFEDIRKGFEQDDFDEVQLQKAFDALKQAVDAAGISFGDLDTKVHLIGQVIPVLNGSVTQFIDTGGHASETVNAINKSLGDMGIAAESAGQSVSGVGKLLQDGTANILPGVITPITEGIKGIGSAAYGLTDATNAVNGGFSIIRAGAKSAGDQAIESFNGAKIAVSSFTDEAKQAADAIEIIGNDTSKTTEEINKAIQDAYLLPKPFQDAAGAVDSLTSSLSVMVNGLDGAIAQAASFASQLNAAAAAANQAFTAFDAASQAREESVAMKVGTFQIYDPAHPEAGGYVPHFTVGPYGGGGINLTYAYPYTIPSGTNSTKQSAGGGSGNSAGNPVYVADTNVQSTLGNLSTAQQQVVDATNKALAGIQQLMATGLSAQEAADRYYLQQDLDTSQLIDVSHMSYSELQATVARLQAEGLSMDDINKKLGGTIKTDAPSTTDGLKTVNTTLQAGFSSLSQGVSQIPAGVAQALAVSGLPGADAASLFGQLQGAGMSVADMMQALAGAGVSAPKAPDSSFSLDRPQLPDPQLLYMLTSRGIPYNDAVGIIEAWQQNNQGLSRGDLMRIFQEHYYVEDANKVQAASSSGVSSGSDQAPSSVSNWVSGVMPPDTWNPAAYVSMLNSSLTPNFSPALTPPPGALQAPVQVTINNPVVTNRSMLDQMAAQLADLNIWRG